MDSYGNKLSTSKLEGIEGTNHFIEGHMFAKSAQLQGEIADRVHKFIWLTGAVIFQLLEVGSRVPDYLGSHSQFHRRQVFRSQANLSPACVSRVRMIGASSVT